MNLWTTLDVRDRSKKLSFCNLQDSMLYFRLTRTKPVLTPGLIELHNPELRLSTRTVRTLGRWSTMSSHKSTAREALPTGKYELPTCPC